MGSECGMTVMEVLLDDEKTLNVEVEIGFFIPPYLVLTVSFCWK